MNAIIVIGIMIGVTGTSIYEFARVNQWYRPWAVLGLLALTATIVWLFYDTLVASQPLTFMWTAIIAAVVTGICWRSVPLHRRQVSSPFSGWRSAWRSTNDD